MSYVDVDAGRDEFEPLLLLYCGLIRSRPPFILLFPLRPESDRVSMCNSFRDCDGPVCCKAKYNCDLSIQPIKRRV